MPPEKPPSTCVLIGSESLLIQCGEILRAKNYAIRAVVSSDPQILAWASSHEIETVPPGPDLVARLRPIGHDYLFSITNLSMLSPALLALPRIVAINFHDGPLPRYAGMYAPVWALLHGETEYGVTFHAMTHGADEGDIYVQRCFGIEPEETSLTLNTHCYAAAIEAFSEMIEGFENGEIEGRPQDLDQRSYFRRHQRPVGRGVLDWRQPAAELARSIRAMNFGPFENAFGSACVMHGGVVHLVRGASQDRDIEGGDPGCVLALDEEGLTVACGDGGALRLTEWTSSRGVPQSPREVARLLRINVGDRLEGLRQTVCNRIDELGSRATRAEAFWVQQLQALEGTEIPYLNRALASDASHGSDSIEIVAPREWNGDADDWIAVFAAYLARTSGRSSVEFSYSDESLREKVEGLEGMFSATLPLRVEIDLASCTGDAMVAIRHGLDQVRSQETFFLDVVARYPRLADNSDLLAGRISRVAVEIRSDVTTGRLMTGMDCILVVTPTGDRARLIHDVHSLSAESARAIVHQLQLFLSGFSNAETPLRKLALLDDAERSKILFEWNDTAVEFPRDRCIHQLFDTQVEKGPDEIALVFEAESLTYRELADRVNSLAHYLVDLGIGPDALVGIYLDRSIDMVVSVLATLKAGGAYVPLDPTYPVDRVAHMIVDSKAAVVLTRDRLQSQVPECDARIVVLDREAEEIAARSIESPEVDVSPENLSYVIYTSGSTGLPKGVMVEHRSAVNFFTGMDACIPHDRPGAWLALTSLSFDISVLELLWTLTRGLKLVVYAEDPSYIETSGIHSWRPLDFGLALWGSDAGPGPRKYELMLEASKFGDSHGFRSVSTPERHFGAFGGPFPNPSVTSAAIAAVTDRIEIRAGSCILPLHHPIRVAEEWAVVDNLSGGRVGIAFASGWQPNDFVMRPEVFADAKKSMFEYASIVQSLWRGDAVEFENPYGTRVPTATLPRPVQKELPSWMTTAGNPDTFRAAGEGGFNVLTHLLGQSLEELAAKVKIYRRARSDAGFDPGTGIVTCMLHTFVGEDLDEVREIVRQPMKDYLASAIALVMGFAWSFPAFERPGGPDAKPEDVDLSSLTEEETDAILEFAFERYFETSGLFGTPEVCASMVERVKTADIDEISCLIDFGVPNDRVLASLPMLNQVRQEANQVPEESKSRSQPGSSEADYSLSAQIAAHEITHMQCTPSQAGMLLADPDTRGAVAQVAHWMIGGEDLPVSLAADLQAAHCRNVTNMYGPTETTIWSSTERIQGRPERISIGRPIANTRFYILGEGDEPLPVGIPGELLIGGAGVARGYHAQPELTDLRFIPDPFSNEPGARLYKTGDLARWNAEGSVELLGRLDHQVKIRGYRVELGEIESRLSAIPGIREAVVTAREDTPGDVRLVAYLITGSAHRSEVDLRSDLATHLPEYMLPSDFVFLDHYPRTPNGKIDRLALPSLSRTRSRSMSEYVPPENELEETIALVWKEILQLDDVGIDDNFFDLGGHSLLVVQAHRRLREGSPKAISLTDLYRFPTVRGLSEYLSAEGDSGKRVEESQIRGEKRRQSLGRRRRRGGQG